MILQALYGEKSSVPKGGVKPQTEEPPGSEEDGELCNDATVDTLFNSAEGVTYAFKGMVSWVYGNIGKQWQSNYSVHVDFLEVPQMFLFLQITDLNFMTKI